jgi:hypothetical protein
LIAKRVQGYGMGRKTERMTNDNSKGHKALEILDFRTTRNGHEIVDRNVSVEVVSVETEMDVSGLQT